MTIRVPALEGELSANTARRRAISGAFFSEFVDMFDIFLPVAVLSPVMMFFQPSTFSNSRDAMFASLVVVTTLLGRPVGALFFGAIADRLGRRKASIYSVSGFAIVTLLIALLPGYEAIGVMSYWSLVLLRFVDGIFLGGGYTGAIPLAFEHSLKNRRGFVGGLIIAGFPAAYLFSNLLTMLMLALFPLHGLHSPYAQWGWRVPFLIGGLLASALAFYYVFKVEESEVWQTEIAEKTGKVALSDLLSGDSGRCLAQVFLLMTGFWLTQNIITIYLPTGLLIRTLHLTPQQASLTLVFTYSLLVFTYIGSGILSQKVGRRPFFVVIGLSIATLGAALLYVLVTFNNLSLEKIALLVCSLAILVTSPWGVVLTYINERFVTDVRATGFGVGFSISVIIPSFYAFYMDWLGMHMPLRVTPVVLLCVGGMLGMLGAIVGPETKNVDF